MTLDEFEDLHPILQLIYDSLHHKGIMLTDSYMLKLQNEIDDMWNESKDEAFDPDNPRY